MDDSRSAVISEGLLAGRLEGTSFPELLVALCGTGGTGVLSVAHAGFKKNVYIEQGRVVFAASEDPDDRLGVQLLRAGAITLHQLETAVKAADRGKRLGALLAEADSISPDQLVDSVLAQVRRIVLELFAVERGEYRFFPGSLPTEEVIALDEPVTALVFEGVRALGSVERIRRGMGGPTAVWCLSEAFDEVLDELELDEGEELVVERLQQGPASMDELCSEVLLSNFEICRLMWSLKVLGVVEQPGGLAVGIGGGPDGREAEDDGGFLELLLQLSRARETGVLYATLGPQERSFHLREGECVFATSNDTEDGLVNFLLRRGVISMRDREETVHRLLSNKRVGTILLELGVLDDEDLHDMVRQQLIEVVYDTFRWSGGEFTFVCGPLPSVEPITLDQSLEALVVTGLRRVTSWARIRRGCGGLRSILALTPGYLDVLDAMNAGAEEWEVVNALRTPRSPLEVCQLSQLGDFRVCQILWAMKVLGGVEVIQAERPEAWEAPAAKLFAEVGEAGAAAEPALEEDEEAPLPFVDRRRRFGEHAGETDAADGDEVELETAAEEVLHPGEAHPVEEPEAVAGDEADVEAAMAEAAEADAGQGPPVGRSSDGESPEDRFAADPAAEAGSGEIEIQDDAAAAEVAEAPGVELEVEAPEDWRGGPGPAPEEPLEAEPAQTPAESPEESRDVPVIEDDTEDDFEGEFDHRPEAATEPVAGGTESTEPALHAAGEPDPDEPHREAAEPDPDPEPEAEADAPDAPSPSIWDLEISSRTVRLARDDVDSALAGPGAPAPKAEGPPPLDAESLEAAERDDPGPAAAAGEDEPAIEIEVEPQPPAPDGLRWVPPADLDVSIARFNAMQRVIYRTVRSEVGAGAANFIRSCCDGGPQGAAVADAELHPDGSWDVEGLREGVIARRSEDPWFDYRRLIGRQIEILRVHIGEARASELNEQVERVAHDDG